MRSCSNQFRQTARQGFTMIELMVVLLVITVILAILIPAVQQSRVTASQLQCRARMKQIGLALHGHEATFGKFPAYDTQRFSWLVPLLPYMDLSTVWDRLDLKKFAGDPENEQFQWMSIEGFCCPADPSRRLGSVNYLGNAGTGFADWNGVFGDKPIGSRDIVDGLSNTAAASEFRGGEWDQPLEHIASGKTRTRAAWRSFVRNCEASGPNKWPPGNWMGRSWLGGGYPNTTYAHILPPGSNSCKPAGDQLVYSVATPRSSHVGGVQVLLADGSVQFVSVSVDRDLWRQQGSRDGSEFPLEDE